MLRFVIDCNIIDELGTNENEKELFDIIENKLKKDTRVTLVDDTNIFYKESDKENLIKDYPEIAEAIEDDDDLETYLEWKYEREDEEIEGVAGKITLDSNDMYSFAKKYLKKFSDDELFNNLQSKIDEADYQAKDLTIRNALIDLLEQVKGYAYREDIDLNLKEVVGSI